MSRSLHWALGIVVAWAVASVAPAAPVIDTSTHGTWISAYGTHGYLLPGYTAEKTDVSSLPAYVANCNLTGTRYQWATSTTDVRGVQNPSAPSERKANATYGSSLDLTVNLTRPLLFELGLYLLDWDGKRSTEISNVPGHATLTATSYDAGHWYRYRVESDATHPVTARLTALTNSAVISAVTFDPVVDRTTQGDWTGAYGSDGYILPGFDSAGGTTRTDRFVLPSWAAGYALNGTRYAWTMAGSDPRAIVSPTDDNDRRASITFDGTQLTFEMPVTESLYVDVALYCLDWDSTRRVGTLSWDGQAFPSQPISDFHDGAWFVHRVYADAAHPLRFTIAKSGVVNVVLSGIMFDNVMFVPEPSTIVLAGLAVAGLLGGGWRRWRARGRRDHRGS